MTTTIYVFEPNGWRCDTYLEYTLWFKSADGHCRWKNGTLSFKLFENAEDQLDDVLQYQTSFVQANWFRIEVMMPNRDAYGHLQPGWIADKGVLLATRQASIVPANPG
jgi:hypothetical protein